MILLEASELKDFNFFQRLLLLRFGHQGPRTSLDQPAYVTQVHDLALDK
jgi:hypothetical protein